MGREALTAALCWFTIGGALTVNSFNDNESAESVSRLYGKLPGVGVYASGAPYGAYSFQVPLVAAPKPAASRVIPVKENYSFQNMNSYLKDSYGNRFVESKQSPQTVPFKPFPQQYVQLQELPAHFAQPLAAPTFAGYKQATPQIIVGSHYRLPLQPLQTASPVKQQYPFSQGTYAGNIKNVAPQSNYYSQFRGPVIQLPVQGQSYRQLPGLSYSQLPGQSFHYGSKVVHDQHPVIHDQKAVTPIPTAQQQSSSNEAVFANVQSEEQYNHDDSPKFDSFDAPRDVSSEEEPLEPAKHVVHHTDKVEQKVPVRETTITSFMNGRKTRVNLKTKAPIPLLDISLLEPLTFDNPLVPQVQHFLPKISEATYHKLPEFNANAKKHQKPTQKTKSYDSVNSKVKPKKFIPKKKQRYPLVEVQNSYYDEIPSASTVRPVITIKGTPNESPEFSYEINSPNYKETYKEQAINYNTETQSEPVHITYGTQKHEEPVHYSYVHSSKEPVHIKEVHYESKGEAPNHSEHKESEKHHASEDSGESSEEDSPPHYHHNEHRNRHNQHPDNHEENHNQVNENHNKYHDNHNQNHGNPSHHHENRNQQNAPPKQSHHQKVEHREEHHQKPSSGSHQNHHEEQTFKPIQYYTKTSSGSFRPVAEYEEEIRIAAPIKVNPNQHVQPQPASQPQNPSTTQQHSHRSQSGSHQHTPPHNSQSHQKNHSPTTHVHEKTKSIIIQEETPEHSDEEHTTGMFGKHEDKEKDFENAYKNAAFGFPAYEKSFDMEKDIFNPASYGYSRNFDVKNSPFQQYQDQSDNFPKSSRLSYKDNMDKTKEDYFLDYSLSKPESLTDYYKKKIDYYKLYKKQKPEKHIAHDESEKQQKNNEKYTAIPYNFYPTQDLNMKQFFAQYKATPFVQEFDYSKGTPRDNSAHSTQPLLRYKSNTFFVEPQFQYGFEPISISRLLDSELATMASNDSPESEKPGLRKKLYKENFYIKKTSMSDAGPSS